MEQIPGVRVLVAAYGLAGDPVDVGQAVQPAAGQDEHTPAAADVNRAQTQSHPVPHSSATTPRSVHAGGRDRVAHLPLGLGNIQLDNSSKFRDSLAVQPNSALTRTILEVPGLGTAQVSLHRRVDIALFSDACNHPNSMSRPDR